MQIFTLLFLLGICSVQLFSHILNLIYCTLIIFPLILWYFLPRPYCKIGQLSFAFMFGFVWMICQSYWQLSLHLPYDNSPVMKIVGTVSSVPEHQPHKIIFNFATTQINQTFYSKWHPYALRMTWYGNQPEHVRVGDKWQLWVRINPSRSYDNPGSFDYQKWLFAHHLYASGTVQNHDNNLLLRVNRWSQPVERCRQYLAEKLQCGLFGLPLAGMIIALCVGIRDLITQQQWQVLRNTGTNHLMAIAGLHISCIASMTYFLIYFIWRRMVRLTLYFPAQQVAALFSLMSAIIYSALAGFALPTQRAFIMLSIFQWAILLRRHISAWDAYYFALLIILIINPFDTLSASFWLSFSIVALIIYGNSYRLKMQGFWWHWGRTQWVISLGIMPLSLLFFQQVSLISFIANSVAIPVVGFIILPLCFVGSLLLVPVPYMGKLLIIFAERILSYLWIILQKMSSITMMQWYSTINHPLIMFSTIISVILLLAPRGWPARWLGLFWVLPLLFQHISAPLIGYIDVTLLDAGKNEIAVIRTTNHTVLYEVLEGNNKNNMFNQQIVYPYLIQKGIKKIDQVFSNAQQSGVTNSEISIGGYRLLSCDNNTSWTWDNIDWQLAKNNDACLLNISYHNLNITLLSASSPEYMKNLVQNKNINLNDTIVIMPYEKFNMDRIFTNNQQLKFILGSYHSRMHANQLAGDNVYSTQQCGTIHFIVNDKGVINRIDCYKIDYHFIWQDMSLH